MCIRDRYQRRVHGKSKRIHKEAEMILKNIDLNRNGKIEYNEFVMANMKLNSVQKEQIFRSAFDFYDLDHNGQITIEEVKRVFGNISDDKTLHRLISEVDKDNDHQISFEEFKSMMDRYDKSVSFTKLRSFTEEISQRNYLIPSV
eukprot:TRINITY_DN39777_c0_g1_i1.p1 TRINITY_DN39777_c0_g1~~TRINITY_DN39777_c0_g1_i1.p1  ORF type:complete len:145 (+),score=34.64 TRINITY_DN39777_c0_g1_i1:118-552(+)